MKKRFLINRIFTFAVGIMFIVLGMLSNETFYSMGIAIIAVGIVKSIQNFIILKDKERLKEYETQMNDERNRYVAQKAHSTAFWTSVYGEFAVFVILTYLGNSKADILSYLICAQVIVYFIAYYIYSRKY